ncbi:type 2 periplasmic-binding domain-containing protein [Marinimicrobium alkaliphilum]|uniref:hypothetical protein n=1 Tax=Marinimicrobium alkaliphilum TaxID=2202654 RepID=UPI0018E08C29|nr:hypothetical protein [Marinimicrobium alkaliphilum]
MPRTFVKIIMTGLLSVLGHFACADVVVVVSDGSPVRTLSATQLADIYLGRLTYLSEGEAIVPIDQAEQTQAHSDFYQHYLGRTPAQIRSHWSRLIFTGRGQPPRAVNSHAALVEAVTRNPNAIGYMDAEAVPDGLRVVDIEF